MNFEDDISGQAFTRLFYQNSNLIDATNTVWKFSQLNNDYGCSRAYESCTSIKKAPSKITI